jgi:hypothetical protein
MYLNTEAGKRLPFQNTFKTFRIADPYEIHEGFDFATRQRENWDGIIVDSVTFLMDMYETVYIMDQANTQKAWGQFAYFFKSMMQEKVVRWGKPTIITAHVRDNLDEIKHEMQTAVPIKGQLRNNGVEAYFSTVVAAKKVTLLELEKYGSRLLTITDEDRELGYKYVFQTRVTKETVGERIRSPMGMFSRDQTYIDNDAQLLLDHLNTFYHGENGEN